MRATSKHVPRGIAGLAAAAVIGMLATPVGRVAAIAQAGQTARAAEGVRLMNGAIDMHFHMDAPAQTGRGGQADIAQVRIAKARGLRALVLKNHNEPTATLAYHLRKEIPDFDLFGGVVMNRPNGGMNPAAVEFMATQVAGSPGRVVWMPAGDTEAEIKASNQPDRPFVAVTKNGALTPDVKEVVSLIARYNLILATGHVLAPDALLILGEARRQGIQHMIATHAMDLSGKMTIPQMQEAAKLGAIIEFDYRNVLDEGARRADAIRAIGPEHCLVSEFWTKNNPREYALPETVGAWVEAMKKRGFTDHELDLMFKDNPARLLGLSHGEHQ
jgi:hypothetical protein